MPPIPSSSPTLLMNSCSPTPMPKNDHIQNQNSKLIHSCSNIKRKEKKSTKIEI
jgi:hypothetical protein